MNAPPGVDSDTSGEDFTPPSSPPPPNPKAQFSLTSLLLPSVRSKKQLKAAQALRGQTPEQAAESTPVAPISRLKKKQVRIAVEKPDADGPFASSPKGDGGHRSQSEDAQIDRPVPLVEVSRRSEDVIEILKLLLAQNEDRDNEQGSTSGHSKTKVEDSTSGGPSQSALDDEAAPPVNHSPTTETRQRLRIGRPTQINLLPRAWRRPKPADASNTPMGPLEEPQLLDHGAEAGSVAPLANATAASAGDLVTEPATAPLSHFQQSQPTMCLNCGTAANTFSTHTSQPPYSAPPWLWVNPNSPTPAAHGIVPTQPHTEMPSTPPWVWAGQGGPSRSAGHALGASVPTSYVNRPSTGPTPAYPPMPPFYPHPPSLQPYNPWYPTQEPAVSSPSKAADSESAYDGLEPSSPLTESYIATRESSRLSKAAEAQSSQLPHDVIGLDTSGKSTEPRRKTKADADDQGPSSSVPAPPEAQASHSRKDDTDQEPSHGTSPHTKLENRNILSKHHTPLIKNTRRHRDPSGKPNSSSPQKSVSEGRPGSPTFTSNHDPSWTECLMALAKAISLLDNMLNAAQHDQKHATSDSRSDIVVNLLSSVLTSLVTQEDVVQGLEHTLGNTQSDAIRNFKHELDTMIAFLTTVTRGVGLKPRDARNAAKMERRASHKLQADSIPSLLLQVIDLSVLLTPAITSAVMALAKDWSNGDLKFKSVVKVGMMIQHELFEERKRKVQAGSLDPDDKWATSQMIKAVDTLYLLLRSDEGLSSQRSHLEDPSETAEGMTSRHRSNQSTNSHERSPSARRRRPMQVLTDPVHGTAVRDHLPTQERDQNAPVTKHPRPGRGAKPLANKPPPDNERCGLSTRNAHSQVLPTTSEDVHVQAPRKVVAPRSVPDSENDTHFSRSPVEVDSAVVEQTHLDSSPSVYSQESPGAYDAISSDDRAARLARADSGSRREEDRHSDGC